MKAKILFTLIAILFMKEVMTYEGEAYVESVKAGSTVAKNRGKK